MTIKENARIKKNHKSDTPLIIYIAVVIGACISLIVRFFDKDLSSNIFSEILGAAFTIFVIDALLVRSKSKRWHIVQEHVDYLIGRTVNHIRDGLSTRVFSFKAELDKNLQEHEVIAAIRKQREIFLNGLSEKNIDELSARIDLHFFNQENYEYLHEKAEDIWKMINMKYSEFLDPNLVALLIELHTNLLDACAHLRLYQKSERFPQEKEHYRLAGTRGVAKNMYKIIRIVIKLKKEGYSAGARFVN